jgi:hypothetical protein
MLNGAVGRGKLGWGKAGAIRRLCERVGVFVGGRGNGGSGSEKPELGGHVPLSSVNFDVRI